MASSQTVSEAAEKALKARDRLWRIYRSARLQRRRELFETHPLGSDLRAFASQIRRFGGDDAAGFLTYVREESRRWLTTAPPEVRAEALSIVSERIQRIRIRAGLHPMDDPLPGDPDDIFRLCRQELT